MTSASDAEWCVHVESERSVGQESRGFESEWSEREGCEGKGGEVGWKQEWREYGGEGRRDESEKNRWAVSTSAVD